MSLKSFRLAFPGLASSVTTAALQEHHANRRTKVADATALTELGAIKRLYRWLLKHKHVRKDVAADVEAIGRRNRGKRQLSISDGQKFYRLALQRATDASLSQAAQEAAAGVLLAMLLGLRSGEIASLRACDVDASNVGCFLNVAYEDGKTVNAKRRLLVPAVLAPVLAAQAKRRLPLALLFDYKGQRHGYKWLERTVWQLCDDAGVQQRVCPHSLRGLFSTLACHVQTTPELVSQLLGHADFSVTRTSYIQPGALESRQAAQVVSMLGSETKP